MPGPVVPVTSVAISPDGLSALSGTGREVRLWDLRTGKEVRSFARKPEGKRGYSVTLTEANVEKALNRETNLSALLDRLLARFVTRRLRTVLSGALTSAVHEEHTTVPRVLLRGAMWTGCPGGESGVADIQVMLGP